MPDVVYNRLYGTHQETVQRLIAVLGPERVYNHNNRLDKLTVYRYLAASDLNQYLPPTAVYSWETLSLWLKQYARVILKPQLGHYGVHIYLIHQTDTDYTIFAETLRNPRYTFTAGQLRNWLTDLMETLPSNKFLLQRWIEPLQYSGRYFDLRLLVQKAVPERWQVTGILSRINRLSYFVSNYAYNIVDGNNLLRQLELVELGDQLQKAAVQTAVLVHDKLGGLAELSVDFIIDTAYQPWIIEVNGKPRKDLFAHCCDETVMQKIYLQPIRYGLAVINDSTRTKHFFGELHRK